MNLSFDNTHNIESAFKKVIFPLKCEDPENDAEFCKKYSDAVEHANELGVYIDYSPSLNAVYVGQTNQIIRRQKEHFKDTFREEGDYECSSTIILAQEDAELYTCFTEDQYDYNFLSKEDKKRELEILEGIVMRACKNSGYTVVNSSKRLNHSYGVEALKGHSFSGYTEEIHLSPNLFTFDLKYNILDQILYGQKRSETNVKELIEQRDHANYKLVQLRHKYVDLKNMANRMQEENESLKKYPGINVKFIEESDFINKCLNMKSKIISIDTVEERFKDSMSDFKNRIEKSNKNKSDEIKEVFQQFISNEEFMKNVREGTKNLRSESLIDSLMAICYDDEEYKHYVGITDDLFSDHDSSSKYIDYTKLFCSPMFIHFLQRRLLLTLNVLSYLEFDYMTEDAEKCKRSIIRNYCKEMHTLAKQLRDWLRNTFIK